MSIQGQVANWEMPAVVTVEGPWEKGWRDVDLWSLLVTHGFAPSMRIAKRLMDDGHVWVDTGLHPNPGQEIRDGRAWLVEPKSTIVERFQRVKERSWLVEPGTVVGVGKNPVMAACHRIVL